MKKNKKRKESMAKATVWGKKNARCNKIDKTCFETHFYSQSEQMNMADMSIML